MLYISWLTYINMDVCEYTQCAHHQMRNPQESNDQHLYIVVICILPNMMSFFIMIYIVAYGVIPYE